MLTLNEKKAIVTEVADVAQSAQSAIAAEYRGLTVSEMTQLRQRARDAGIYLRVVKNTLARRALADTDYACMNDELVGPLVLAFSQEDPSSAAKVVRDFSKEHDRLVVKIVAVNGTLMGPGDLESLASLPNRDEAISMLMGVMKAPIEKFVRTLAEPHGKLARTLTAVKDKKASSA